jgi:hypothetical protein
VRSDAGAGVRKCTIKITANNKYKDGEVASKYNSVHLDNLFRASALYKEVSVRIGEDYPAELLFTDNNGKLRFVLGPIVANE